MYTSNLPADAPFFLCTTLLVHPLGILGPTHAGSGTMKNQSKSSHERSSTLDRFFTSPLAKRQRPATEEEETYLE